MRASPRLIVLISTAVVIALVAIAGYTFVTPAKKSALSVGDWSVIQPAIVGGASGPTATGTPGSPAPSPSAATRSPTPAGPPPLHGTMHFIANVGNQMSQVEALGFNLIDTGPDPETVNALPAGVRALVWLGSLDNADCGNPGYTFSAFKTAVNRLIGNPKVFGYFLADEPHPATCTSAVADLRERADYIHSHDPTHRSFVVILDGSNHCNGAYGCEYSAMGPAKTHVDLVGLDPYPCNTGNATSGCDYSDIDATIKRAEKYGIPASAIVPVFQVFGQSCAGSDYYRMPKATELSTMLAHWKALVPHPAFDYSYGWERQDSACPTLADANGSGGIPNLQAVIKQHNLG